ncbi:universal stress protein [Variovorax sp. Root434]|uniref:universal stress protein n=1 Tax=Variovorax sp. Root434 TaxID=1736536 RepID=UPI0006FD1FBF|nr:universal stress protein [Variovorax sp. Root434]KQX31913.1 universal stress protein UspA [Variovorax sp. Root434]
MTLSTISVHLDHTECCEVRTRLAARLARLHGSHLMGIVPTWAPAGTGPAPRASGELDRTIVEASLYLRRRAETVAHVFHSRIRPAASSSDARLVDGDPVQAVVHHGRASDLIVVGQADEAAALCEAASRLPEQVMLNAGRPVLIVPRADRRISRGLDRILVAWDGSREASMSLRGAIPLLRGATHVTLLSLRRDTAAGPPDAPDPEDLSGWLLRHGVQASVERLVTSLRISDALLDRADVLGSDLLVMGGYGHARAQEQLLGGVTREVLMRTSVPLLMAH